MHQKRDSLIPSDGKSVKNGVYCVPSVRVAIECVMGKDITPCISPSTHDISPQRKHHWRVSGIESLLIGRIVMQSFAAEMHIDQHFTSNPMSQPNSGVNPTNVHLYFAYNLFNRRAIKATKAPNLLIKPSIELASQWHDNKDRKSTTRRQQNFILLLYSYIAF